MRLAPPTHSGLPATHLATAAIDTSLLKIQVPVVVYMKDKLEEIEYYVHTKDILEEIE
jgi:hypothetical protein